MCGISGWFDMAGTRPANRALLKAMTDAIAHRGPDGEGFHFEPGLALGHRRLAIIDLATGEQPMFTEGDRIAVVFNGEIFNYRELRRRLEDRGHGFRTQSDTEVILRSWVEWGPECVDRLHGQFAIALWDRRDQTLFLARDRLGEKPLYYAMLADQTLLFGSELKALMVSPAVNRAVDPCAVEDFFALGYITDPRTIFSSVKKLDAATTLLLRRGSPPRFRQYWDPKPTGESERSLDDAAAALRERLGAAVRSQLVADVPVGSFLSGGVDSSAVTSLMALTVPEAVNCFTIGFDDRQYDERAYAEAVASRYGTRHQVEVVSPDDFDTVAALPGIFDEPFGDSSSLPTFRLARLARRSVKVALSGDGGDELFAGYRRYLFHGREEAFRAVLPQALRKPLFGTLGRLYPQLDWAPRPLRARQTFRELGCSAAEGYFHNLAVVDDDTRYSLYSPELRRRIGGYRASDVIAAHMAKAPSDDPVAVAQYVDLKTWLVGDILTKVDRTAMANSLEVRVPMLDPGFVEWSMGLPRSLKLAGGEGKVVLKRALEPLVPHDVLYRRKQGFSVPLASWFRGSLGEAFARQLASGAEGLGEHFDLKLVKRLCDSHRQGWADHSRTLWLLWMFQGFLRTCEARPPRRSPALELA
ncbi:MAG: amidotransferase 1, exosortase A system-associated [Alphaproteobacteria bacterium]|nr:amidotransferase 1, exosortase A system-associated [Alphaproteobacteria bacterium]